MTGPRLPLLSLVAVALLAGPAGAQPADLSGTWRLDEEASEIDPTVPYSALGGNVGTPSTLYVTHAKNGTIIVGSNTNTSHARTYEPDAHSVTPIDGGEVRVKARWEGSTLVAEGRDTAAGTDLRETLGLEGDGQRLVVSITTRGADDGSSRLVYTRMREELPCKEWATPCRDWPQGD